jgi:hypothetical protein
MVRSIPRRDKVVTTSPSRARRKHWHATCASQESCHVAVRIIVAVQFAARLGGFIFRNGEGPGEPPLRDPANCGERGLIFGSQERLARDPKRDTCCKLPGAGLNSLYENANLFEVWGTRGDL